MFIMGPRAALLVAAVLGFAAYAAVAQQTTFASLFSSHDDYRGEPDHRNRDNYPHNHPYGEANHICLRKRSVRKCDIVGLFAGVTYESGLECCPSDSRYGDGPNDNLPRDGDFGKAAKCTWRIEPYLIRTLGLILFSRKFKAPIQIGAFNVDCEFSKVAEECNDGLCEDMRISAKGPVWFVPKAAVSGLPTLEGTTPCARAINDFSDALGLQSTQLSGAAAANATNATDWDITAQNALRSLDLFFPANPGERESPFAPEDSSEPDAETQGASSKAETMSSSYSQVQHYEASVVVAYGHVEVKGKHTSKKYDEGFLEATLLYFTKDDRRGRPKKTVPDTTTFVTEPYKYSITLKNREPYGSY